MTHDLWASEVASKIKAKMKTVVIRTGEKIPYTTENGRFDDWTQKNICWWTNGFWGGILWQLYHSTKDPVYYDSAIALEKKLDVNLMDYNGLDHDNGFKWLPTAVAHYRIEENEASLQRGLLAASHLAGRFNLAASLIRAWNGTEDKRVIGWAIIDCMMNLPLLYWASEKLDDPRFAHIAKAHADTAMKVFVRENGSVKHIVQFDPVTGEYERSYGGQGYQRGSSWTRGQAWAIYDFTLSYLHTKDARYLETARKIADHFISVTPESGLIPVDFDQPSDCTWQDSTAAAIASCGMLELAKLEEAPENSSYYKAAVKMLQALDAHSCNWTDETDNIVEKCTAAYSDTTHEFSIIYGDYFFIEAIFKLTGEELFIW